MNRRKFLEVLVSVGILSSTKEVKASSKEVTETSKEVTETSKEVTETPINNQCDCSSRFDIFNV